MWGQECVNNCSMRLPKMNLQRKYYWGEGEAFCCFSDFFSSQWCGCIYHDWCHIKYIVALSQNQVRGYVLNKNNQNLTTKQHKTVVRSFTCSWWYERAAMSHCTAWLRICCYCERRKCCGFRPCTGSHTEFSNQHVSLK